MNYKRIYGQIIKNRLANTLPESEYGQKHHILPKSLYPQYKNTKTNIVKLTYREHYICHWLLTKIRPCRQMLAAFWLMNCCQNDLYSNSHAYNEIKRAVKGLIYTDEYREKMSLALIGKNKGKTRTDEQRKRISEKCKGIKRKQPFSEEHRRKLSESNKRRTPPTKNKRWINNGDKQVYMNVSLQLPEGYVFGRLKRIKN